MSGTFTHIVHRCVTPEITPELGDGTSWVCDCGKEWSLYRGIYGTNWGYITSGILTITPPSRWDNFIARLKRDRA